jgi:carboxyl-terminal processing protease
MLKKLFILKLLLFVSFAVQTLAQTLPLEERVEIFEEVWRVIDEKYYDPEFNGVDWKALKKRYRPLVEREENAAGFYLLLERMAGELNDSHTRVYSPEGRRARLEKKSSSVGLKIGRVENEFVVTRVLAGSKAEAAGVKAGMTVKTIDGKPAADAFAEARRAVGASSSERSAEMRAFSQMLSGDPEKTIRVELENFDGKIFGVELVRESLSNETKFSAEILPSGVAYLKFGAFDEETPLKVSEVLKKHAANGLILDLRGNPGGDGDAGLQVAGFFLDKKQTVARIVTRTGKPPLPEIPMTLEAGETGGQIFAKPLVILTDERTASVSELIANFLQERKRAYVIGRPTCGCVLAFLGYRKIKGGGDLSVSEFGFVTSAGKTLEGRGVTPDRIISPTLKDLRKNRDAALDEAIKHLKISK